MSDAEQGGAGRREVAYRVFAAEYDDADYSYSESDEERAPNYVITPTGARVNRLFVVGVLTEVEQVSEDVLRARVVDPTGAFVLYAGQYQPDEQAVLERIEPPTFVAVTGKARTFQPEDSDQVFTSIRPESINEVDVETRDRWIVQTAEQTLDRIGWMAATLDRPESDRADWIDRQDIDEGLAAGISLAIDHYGTTPTYLDAIRELSLDAVRVVTDELDEIESPGLSPDATGDVRPSDLASSTTDEAVDADVSATDPASATGSAAETMPDDSTDDERAADSSVADESEETTQVDESVERSGVEESAETTQVEDAAEIADSGGSAETTVDKSTDTAAIDEPVDTKSEDTADVTTEQIDSESTVDGPEGSADTDESGTTGPGDFDPDEFELETETREQIEEEYGTDFQSGTEVDEPGAAGIDTPEPETPEPQDAEPNGADPSETTEPASSKASATTEPDETDEPAETVASESAEAAEPPEDLQEALLSVMAKLDDGDGVGRDTLVETMEQRFGTDPEIVEDEIQSALMDGQCYEPDDSTLKPI